MGVAKLRFTAMIDGRLHVMQRPQSIENFTEQAAFGMHVTDGRPTWKASVQNTSLH